MQDEASLLGGLLSLGFVDGPFLVGPFRGVPVALGVAEDPFLLSDKEEGVSVRLEDVRVERRLGGGGGVFLGTVFLPLGRPLVRFFTEEELTPESLEIVSGLLIVLASFCSVSDIGEFGVSLSEWFFLLGTNASDSLLFVSARGLLVLDWEKSNDSC